MPKTRLHIEIVSSTNIELSSMSALSRLAVQKSLAKNFSQVGITIVNDLNDLEGLVAKQPDVVFLGMQYIVSDSEKIWLSQYLTNNGIAATGSGQTAHFLEQNKPLAKQAVLHSGLASAGYFVVSANDALRLPYREVDYPVFVKPANRGGGSGIDENSVAQNFLQLSAKVKSIAAQFKCDSLVEQYLPGREFSVAILKNSDYGYSTMPLELIAPENKAGDRILSSRVKAGNTESFIAVTDTAIKQDVIQLALNAFHSIGGRDYGRIDVRLDAQNKAHFLEANLIPSLLDGYGSFPKACWLNARLNYGKMLVDIVKLAQTRMPFAAENTYIDYPEFAPETFTEIPNISVM